MWSTLGDEECLPEVSIAAGEMTLEGQSTISEVEVATGTIELAAVEIPSVFHSSAVNDRTEEDSRENEARYVRVCLAVQEEKELWRSNLGLDCSVVTVRDGPAPPRFSSHLYNFFSLLISQARAAVSSNESAAGAFLVPFIQPHPVPGAVQPLS